MALGVETGSACLRMRRRYLARKTQGGPFL